MKEDEFLEEEQEGFWKGPIKAIVALILVVMMILWFVPHYAIKVDPQPRYVPSIEDVFNNNINISNTSHRVHNRDEFRNFVDYTNPVVKQAANSISSAGCDGSSVCNAKALFYFTQRNINYVHDPDLEYAQYPTETLSSRGGDCDDMAVLLASLTSAVGIETRLVFIPRHAYLEVRLPDAGKAYKNEYGWVALDPTCDSCKFGEIPYQNLPKDKEYVYI